MYVTVHAPDWIDDRERISSPCGGFTVNTDLPTAGPLPQGGNSRSGPAKLHHISTPIYSKPYFMCFCRYLM